jgi:hypothetical protein
LILAYGTLPVKYPQKMRSSRKQPINRLNALLPSGKPEHFGVSQQGRDIEKTVLYFAKNALIFTERFSLKKSEI